MATGHDNSVDPVGREIAADAGPTAGALQHCFDGREDLLRAAYRKVGNDQI